MITAGQIKEKLVEEKDPIKYIDAEIDQCLGVWESQFDKIKETISAYRNRPDESLPFDLKDVKEDFRQIGEMYGEISAYLKVRKAELKRLKQAENVRKAQLKRQEWLEKRDKKGPER
ncbi:hypothetical protein [Methanocella sp. MCL-LM]|uniref:hypothetical protein n=1 Tax=Methanocella sp. MCL-LM TaxID=3412035 RepID=UPI003C7330C7